MRTETIIRMLEDLIVRIREYDSCDTKTTTTSCDTKTTTTSCDRETTTTPCDTVTTYRC